ncbi:MAG: hypothetical protein ACRD50_13345 [Candidatus Acidiferrales bacterium]
MPRSLSWTMTRCFLLIIYACSHAYAQSQTPKITRIKLEDYGWQPVPNGPQSFGHIYWPNLKLDHKGRVLVGFTVREGYALATGEHPGRSFRILRFAAEGKLDLSLDLPTNDWYRNGFYLGPDDQIFARANDTLQIFSENESGKKDAAWRPVVPCPAGNCFISQSGSRRTLVLRVEPLVGGRDRSTYTILDASSSPPRVVRTCSQMAFWAEQITDRFAYWPFYDRDDDLMVRFPFCDVDHYEEFPKLGRGAMAHILNDEVFLKIGITLHGPFKVELVGVDGQVKFSKEAPKHEKIDPNKIATDERYDRFAFMVITVRGAHPSLDISGHVVARRILVLDQTGNELSSIPTETNYHLDFNFAMSPDGHRLAILDEGVVTIVELP